MPISVLHHHVINHHSLGFPCLLKSTWKWKGKHFDASKYGKLTEAFMHGKSKQNCHEMRSLNIYSCAPYQNPNYVTPSWTMFKKEMQQRQQKSSSLFLLSIYCIKIYPTKAKVVKFDVIWRLMWCWRYLINNVTHFLESP